MFSFSDLDFQTTENAVDRLNIINFIIKLYWSLKILCANDYLVEIKIQCRLLIAKKYKR